MVSRVPQGLAWSNRSEVVCGLSNGSGVANNRVEEKNHHAVKAQLEARGTNAISLGKGRLGFTQDDTC